MSPFQIFDSSASRLNTIPGPAVESIEILTDGASVIYGADAVAGVVTIKLRHDHRGAEGLIEYGNTLDKDDGEFASSLLFGVGDTNTNVSGVLNYYHRNPFSIGTGDFRITASLCSRAAAQIRASLRFPRRRCLCEGWQGQRHEPRRHGEAMASVEIGQGLAVCLERVQSEETSQSAAKTDKKAAGGDGGTIAPEGVFGKEAASDSSGKPDSDRQQHPVKAFFAKIVGRGSDN